MKKNFLMLSIALLLSGCAMRGEPVSFDCPDVGLMRSADRVALFEGTISPAPEDITAYGMIRDYRGTCSPKTVETAGVDSTDSQKAPSQKTLAGVHFDLDIDFMAERGHQDATLKSVTFPYFIAILAPDETIIAKHAFQTTLSIKDGANMTTESHRLYIPYEESSLARGLPKVIMGYIITPAQKSFNEEQNKAEPRPLVNNDMGGSP